MTIEEMVLNKLRVLPPERQQEVLQFVESLAPDSSTKKPLHSLEGLLEDLNVDISAENIDEARREMWKKSTVS